MKALLLTLLISCCTVAYAGNGFAKRPGTGGSTIGEVQQKVTVIGRSPKDWLTGCKEQGFYVAAYLRPDGTRQVYTYCGTIDPNTKTLIITTDQGI